MSVLPKGTVSCNSPKPTMITFFFSVSPGVAKCGWVRAGVSHSCRDWVKAAVSQNRSENRRESVWSSVTQALTGRHRQTETPSFLPSTCQHCIPYLLLPSPSASPSLHPTTVQRRGKARGGVPIASTPYIFFKAAGPSWQRPFPSLPSVGEGKVLHQSPFNTPSPYHGLCWRRVSIASTSPNLRDAALEMYWIAMLLSWRF